MLRLNSKKAIPRHLPILRRSALQLHALYHGISSQIPFFQGQGSRPTTASNLNFLHQFPLAPELPANLFHQLFLISAHKNFQSPNPPIPLTDKFVDFFLQLFPPPRFYHQQPLVIFSVSVVSPVLLQPLFHIFSHANFHRFFAKFQHIHASLNSFFSHLLPTKKIIHSHSFTRFARIFQTAESTTFCCHKYSSCFPSRPKVLSPNFTPPSSRFSLLCAGFTSSSCSGIKSLSLSGLTTEFGQPHQAPQY